MRDLSEAVSGKNLILTITNLVLNETKWLLEFIGHSKSKHIMEIGFGGSAIAQ
jgi:hypothetical protein